MGAQISNSDFMIQYEGALVLDDEDVKLMVGRFEKLPPNREKRISAECLMPISVCLDDDQTITERISIFSSFTDLDALARMCARSPFSVQIRYFDAYSLNPTIVENDRGTHMLLRYFSTSK